MKVELTSLCGLLIDFSGTLFDYRTVIQPEKIEKLALERNIKADLPTIQQFCNLILAKADSVEGRRRREGCDLSSQHHERVWKQLATEAIGPSHQSLVDLFFDSLIDPANWAPFSDAELFLQAIKEQHKKICIISNIAWDIRQAFQKANLFKYVDQFVLSYELGLAKPSERFFNLACKAIECSREKTIIIGDDPEADNAEQYGIKSLILPPVLAGERSRGLMNILL